MGFLEHLGELRTRLITCAIAITLLACVSYSFSEWLFNLLTRPYFNAFAHDTLIGTGPAEAFMLRIKVSFFSGLLLSLPVLFYQLWMFVAPGLYHEERRLVLPFVVISSLLFAAGASFCYKIIFPFAFDFFKEQYQAIGLTPAIRMTEHLSVMVQGMLGFGLVFEMPVAAYFLGRAGIINHRMMISGLRYAIVIIFIAAGVLTPPDVLTQFLMALPLLALYGISILIVKYCGSAVASEPPTSPDQPNL